MTRPWRGIAASSRALCTLFLVSSVPLCALAATAPAGEVWETSFESTRPYTNAFLQVEVDVTFRRDGREWKVPAFWRGGDRWSVRFAPPAAGRYEYQVTCSDAANAGLNGQTQVLEVTRYTGTNAFFHHGMLRVSADGRHFEHSDGTPFFWLADTWWKGLARRLTWEGFQELAADRKTKGFSVVQIVCGPYPDEAWFDPRLANEAGMPYTSRDYAQVNPAYFDAADRRLRHLVDCGIAPAIVGCWGRGDCDSLREIGADRLKRHWRYLVARYAAYPVFWILAGEIPDQTKWGQGPWAEVGKYLRSVDPYHHPLTCHTGKGRRGAAGDDVLIDFDMVGGSHDESVATASDTLSILTSARETRPPMPVLCGETCYEGHMQQGFGDTQRHIFWMNILSGAAGHTYGAAGIWHAGVEGDPGHTGAWGHPYDFTTWEEGMNYPGSTQLGLGKKLLEQYPWWRFEPHPEWVENGCFAAGIPGEVRFIYQPRRKIYEWNGTVVKGLEPEVPYHVFYFNPANGKRHDVGTIVRTGPAPLPFGELSRPLLFSDHFEGTATGAWKDYGTPCQRQGGALIGGKGLLTVLNTPAGSNLMASVEAKSGAEAGIVLRFHGTNEYLVALYSPLLKAIYLHERRNSDWGPQLGRVEVREVGPSIKLTAGVCGDHAAVVLTDGTRTYATRTVPVANSAPGPVGLWLYQVGERQEFRNFELSRAEFAASPASTNGPDRTVLTSDEYKTPGVPSPQDWVLVLERLSQ